MIYYQNQRKHSVLVSTPRGSNATIPEGHFVEGEFFARFTFLTSVDEAAVDQAKVAYRQSDYAHYVIPVTSAPEPTPESAPEAVEEEAVVTGEDNQPQVVEATTPKRKGGRPKKST